MEPNSYGAWIVDATGAKYAVEFGRLDLLPRALAHKRWWIATMRRHGAWRRYAFDKNAPGPVYPCRIVSETYFDGSATS